MYGAKLYELKEQKSEEKKEKEEQRIKEEEKIRICKKKNRNHKERFRRTC